MNDIRVKDESAPDSKPIDIIPLSCAGLCVNCEVIYNICINNYICPRCGSAHVLLVEHQFKGSVNGGENKQNVKASESRL